MLPSLYVDVLVTIQKEVIPCVNVALKQQTDPLSFLISLREVSDRFASSIQVAGLLQGESKLPDALTAQHPSLGN